MRISQLIYAQNDPKEADEGPGIAEAMGEPFLKPGETPPTSFDVFDQSPTKGSFRGGGGGAGGGGFPHYD